MLLTLLLDEVGQYVRMEVVDLYHRDAEREGEPLGKVRPDKQRA